MSGAQMMMIGAGGAPLATYSLTTGNTGAVGFRYRGYDDGTISGTAIGSVSPTSFTLNGGSVLEAFLYDEDASQYRLAVFGGTNSGWTSVNIGGLLTLNQGSATYSLVSGTSYWNWTTSDTIAAQAFGGTGASRTINFF